MGVYGTGIMKDFGEDCRVSSRRMLGQSRQLSTIER